MSRLGLEEFAETPALLRTLLPFLVLGEHWIYFLPVQAFQVLESEKSISFSM